MSRFDTPRSSAVRTVAAIAALGLAACNGGSDLDPQADPAEVIELPDAEAFPEGVAIADDGTLFTGSLTSGRIYMARAGAERAELFADAGDGALGLLIDEARSLLWACASNPFVGSPPAIVGFDLASGEEAVRHGFPDDTGLCNDLALSDDGDLYATDSLAHRIIRVDAGEARRPDSARTWLADPAFVVPEGTFGLNGVVFDGDTLYTVTYETGALFAIDVSAAGDPGPVRALELDRPLSAGDGLKREAAGRLLVVEGGAGALTRLVLDGERAIIEPVLTGLDSPTTVALHGGWAWIPISQFDHLFGFDPAPAEDRFFVMGHPLGE